MPITRQRAAALALFLASALLVLAGCGSDSSSSSSATTGAPATTAGAPKATGTINVFAAASLTDAFNEAAKTFQSENPGATVKPNYAASSALVTQIDQGAPADVFASADDANMQKAQANGDIAGQPVTFATNSLQIIVAKGNPKNVTGLADLAKPGVTYVTAGPDVPIAKYALQSLQKAGVTVNPVSQEADVKGIVTKVVSSGEADAGIVYSTDVKAAGSNAQGVDIPAAYQVVATYPIAVTKEATNASGAQAWITFITGTEGQAILAKYGFGHP
jgi:molybdate transport system substrate-binding protein